jgi:hypothetical protein
MNIEKSFTQNYTPYGLPWAIYLKWSQSTPVPASAPWALFLQHLIIWNYNAYLFLWVVLLSIFLLKCTFKKRGTLVYILIIVKSKNLDNTLW